MPTSDRFPRFVTAEASWRRRPLLGAAFASAGGRVLRRLVFLSGFSALLLALAACAPARIGASAAGAAGSGGSPAGAAPQAPAEVRLIVKEWSFQPAQLQLQAGRPTKVILENQGNIEHDVTASALGLHLVAGAGKTAEAVVTPTKDGAFDFECSIPGHKEAGMRGSGLVASGAPGGANPAAGAASEAAAVATSAAVAAQHASHAAVATTATEGNQEARYRLDGDVKVFDLKAEHIKWEVLPGEFIDAYAYNGQVPGPIIRVKEGDRVRVNLTNELPEATVVHFHGPRLPNTMDGVPDVTQKPVEPGASFTYEFVAQPAGSFVYHTHLNSATQEPKGLYGLFLVEPRVPPIAYDKELIQVLGESGGFFLINGKSFPATQSLEAKVGERILIRLVNLGQMTHPMHLHGHPFKIVATDGHPVPEGQALTKDVVNIGPGERYDLLVELNNPGTWVFHCHILSHVQNKGVEPGGMITVLKVTA